MFPLSSPKCPLWCWLHRPVIDWVQMIELWGRKKTSGDSCLTRRMQFANKEKNSFHRLKLYQLPKKSIYPVLSIFKMYLSPHHLNWKRGPKQDPQKPVMSWNLILKFTFSRNHRSQIWVQVLSVLLAWESRAGADTDKLRVKIMRRWIRYWSNQIHHPQSFTQTAKYKTYKICHT